MFRRRGAVWRRLRSGSRRSVCASPGPVALFRRFTDRGYTPPLAPVQNRLPHFEPKWGIWAPLKGSPMPQTNTTRPRLIFDLSSIESEYRGGRRFLPDPEAET